MKKSIILSILLTFSMLLSASNVSVKSAIDSTVFMIGNLAELKFSVTQNANDLVQFPSFGETISDGVEIVKDIPADTTTLGNNRIEITKRYMVSAYDSGVYFVPELPFVEMMENDTAWSKGLAFRTITFDVDTTKLDSANIELFDIKPVIKPPFSWAYFFKILFFVLLGLLVVVAIAYVAYRYAKRQPIIPQRQEPQIDPYDEAMSELEKIKVEKLWQKDREKEFQTQLTEVLRNYLSRQFGINAKEMTSDEILDEVRRNEECRNVYDELSVILKNADMVKFAKIKLSPIENETSISKAYDVLNETKKEDLQPTEDDAK